MADELQEKKVRYESNIEPIVISSSDTTTQYSKDQEKHEWNPFLNARILEEHTDDDKYLLTREKLCSMLVELFVVFIDQIFYYREIYPAESFRRLKSFELFVYQNRHPGVIEYLANLQRKLYELISQGNLNRLIIEVHSQEQKDKQKDTLLEVFGLSIANSPILKQLALGDAVKLKFSKEDFNLALVYAEFQSLLKSMITVLNQQKRGSGTDTNGTVTSATAQSSTNSSNSAPHSPPNTFKILISPVFDNNPDAFVKLVSNEDWILERTSQTKTETKVDPSRMVNFKDVDLKFLQIKGFDLNLAD